MAIIQTTQLDIPSGMIHLGSGQPAPSLLPLDLLKQAALHRLSQHDPSLLYYGAEQGDGYFRMALAQFLSDHYGMPVTADNLFITTGASQALDLICTLFTQPGDTIFVEEPSYFLALRIFADHHLRVVGLPMDEEGLIIEALEERLSEHKPAFLYTVPIFHNPASVTLTAARRERLVSLSAQYNFLVVADEVYHLLAYTITPPPPMVSYDSFGTVLSLGSFSKILAPGLRLGWIQAAPVLLERFIKSGLLDSGGGLNPFTSGIVRSALELGLQRNHLARLRTVYSRQAVALSVALRRYFPLSAAFRQPEGGFFIWLCLPREFDTAALLPLARQHRVGFQPGGRFSSKQGLRNFMRLSFAFYDIDDLEEGVQRLAQVVSHRM